jgi:hypothetical protein
MSIRHASLGHYTRIGPLAVKFTLQCMPCFILLLPCIAFFNFEPQDFRYSGLVENQVPIFLNNMFSVHIIKKLLFFVNGMLVLTHSYYCVCVSEHALSSTPTSIHPIQRHRRYHYPSEVFRTPLKSQLRFSSVQPPALLAPSISPLHLQLFKYMQ